MFRESLFNGEEINACGSSSYWSTWVTQYQVIHVPLYYKQLIWSSMNCPEDAALAKNPNYYMQFAYYAIYIK